LLTNTNNKSSNLLTGHTNVYAESKNITPDAKFASGGGAPGLSASHSERVSIGVMKDAENASLKAQ
tara:strand:- start:112 stop:309 length:198 start_codon:yes stop_codon:yes gene_type:complete